MKITNRLFTYPVLSEDKDDYKESVFKVDFQHSMQGVNSILLSFDITMTCPELEALILSGQAQYVIHLECATTAYREVIPSVSKHIDYTLPIGRVNGNLDVTAFIILKKNITGFSVMDWMEDYDGISFNLIAGSILAYQNITELEISKDFEEFTNAGSIFTIYHRLTDVDKPAEISLDSSKIRIGLGTKEFTTFSSFGKNTDLQGILYAMIVLPALVYVFEELKQADGIETYHNKNWFLSLEKAYRARKLDFQNEVLNTEKTSYQLAQEAMELPLSRGLEKIPVLLTHAEEDF